MSNRLAKESSPYLLQHADNPVDWFPWGEEALQVSQQEDKPIFLSIGYSACHWCHVMERESFANQDIAQLLNKSFVSIKVDREERPDLDQLYMRAVMLLRGSQVGWPLSVFLTPDQEVFFGGTYWPPHDKSGEPGFDTVLQKVLEAYKSQRAQIVDQAKQLSEHLRKQVTPNASAKLDTQIVHRAVDELRQSFDQQLGGFGSAPKFPQPIALQLLLQLASHPKSEPTPPDSKSLFDMVDVSLSRMAAGGIYDHLGGGFSRYSVDREWRVPHFEKMLYDNGLLARTYCEAFQLTRNELFAEVARGVLKYVQREMTNKQGGFLSAEDADTDGQEGTFYVWTADEIDSILGEEIAYRFCKCYDVTKQGNFEDGKSVLNLSDGIQHLCQEWNLSQADLLAELNASRSALFEARSKRTAPRKDNKVILSWNAIMIDAFAIASSLFSDHQLRQSAVDAATFIRTEFLQPNGDLVHSWLGEKSTQLAFLDDYACLINALVTLYEATFDEEWIDWAVATAERMLTQFEDQEKGGFFFTGTHHEKLIARSKDWHDGSTPSGNGMAATGLIRLGRLTNRDDFVQSAYRSLQVSLAAAERFPSAATQSLLAVDRLVSDSQEMVIVAPNQDSLSKIIDEVHKLPAGHRVVAARIMNGLGHRSPHLTSLFQDRLSAGEEPRLYFCQNKTCATPVVGEQRVVEHLRDLQEDVHRSLESTL